MIQESAADFLPIWMLLSAAFGFLIGDAFGDSTRHRKCLQQANDNLRDEIEKAIANEEPLHRALKQQRGVLNDIHKQIIAVTKALQKRPS
jgi:septal ring factor EnvC (AmiA/AmiB activator)